MNAESWDEARDLRRFWWLVPPLTFALLTLAVTVYATRGDHPANGRSLSDDVIQTFEAGERPSLVVDTVAGDVTVSKGSGTSVQVFVRRRATGASDDEAFENLARLHLAITATSSVVTITASEEREPVASGRVRADIRVIVPAATEVDIATGNGAVILNGIQGHIGAFSARGDVAASINADALFKVFVSGRKFRSEIPIIQDPTAPTQSSFHGHTGTNPGRVIKLSAPNGTVDIKAE